MSRELEELYEELEDVKSRKEEFLEDYGGESRESLIELIEGDIEYLKRLEDDGDYEDEEEVERERTALCMSQGISRFC